MLRTLFPAILALGVLALAGCGSSDGGLATGYTDVNINLTDAQNVTRVVISHQVPGSYAGWETVFDQDYRNQNTIDLSFQFIRGDRYRVQAQTVDPFDGTSHLSVQEFVAGDNSSPYTYDEPLYGSRQVRGASAFRVRGMHAVPAAG